MWTAMGTRLGLTMSCGESAILRVGFFNPDTGMPCGTFDLLDGRMRKCDYIRMESEPGIRGQRS